MDYRYQEGSHELTFTVGVLGPHRSQGTDTLAHWCAHTFCPPSQSDGAERANGTHGATPGDSLDGRQNCWDHGANFGDMLKGALRREKQPLTQLSQPLQE